MNDIHEVFIESELTNQPEVQIIFTICRDNNFDNNILWDNESIEGRLINILIKQMKAEVEVDYFKNVIVHVRFTKADIKGSGAYDFFSG